MNKAPEPGQLAPASEVGRVYRFESFALDADARRLTRDGEEIVLPPRVFDLLLALLHAPGVLLTRERLLNEVWADTVVADSSLTQSMSVLRREIERDGARLIRTIPRVGYRFEARVEIHSRRNMPPHDAGIAVVGASADGTLQPDHAGIAARSATARRAPRAVRQVLLLLGAITLAGLVGSWWDRGDTAAPVAGARPSPEVLDTYTQGLALAAQFQLRAARERLQSAAERASGFAPAHLALAEVLDQLGERARALRESEAALAAAASLTPAARLNAQALNLELRGVWPQACALREQAVRESPSEVAASLGLAHCLLRDGRANRASALLSEVTPKAPGPERWRALLLDAQVQIAQASYEAATARAQDVAAAAAALQAPALRAKALTIEAEARMLAGQSGPAQALVSEAVQTLRSLGDVGGAAAAEQKVLVLALLRSDAPQAEQVLRGHLQLADELGDPLLAAHAHRLLAAAINSQGRLVESRRHLEQALAGFVAVGDRIWQSKIGLNLGMRDELVGAFDTAEARVRDALNTFAPRSFERWFAHNELAYILRHQGRYDDALRAAEGAVDAAAHDPSPLRMLQVRCERGWTLLQLGRHDEAEADLRECRRFDGADRAVEKRPALAAYAAIGLALIAEGPRRAVEGEARWAEAVAGIDAIGDPAIRAAVQVEILLAGLELGIDGARLQALRIEVPPEFVRLQVRRGLADAWLQRTQGDARWADGLAELSAGIAASDWSTRSLALLLQAQPGGASSPNDARDALLAEAQRKGDVRILALLDRLAPVAR